MPGIVLGSNPYTPIYLPEGSNGIAIPNPGVQDYLKIENTFAQLAGARNTPNNFGKYGYQPDQFHFSELAQTMGIGAYGSKTQQSEITQGQLVQLDQNVTTRVDFLSHYGLQLQPQVLNANMSFATRLKQAADFMMTNYITLASMDGNSASISSADISQVVQRSQSQIISPTTLQQAFLHPPV